MNERPKSKILVIIIGSLLVANIVMLAFMLVNDGRKKEKKDRVDRQTYINDYLQKEIGFDKEQMTRYDSLSKRQREQVKASITDFSEARKKILAGVAAAGFNDSAMNDAANNIQEKQKTLELNMLKHLKEIRDICTAVQRPRFDTSFYKIIGRRGDSHK